MGLAQPNMKPDLENNKIIGKMIVPKMSMCCIGLNDRRPACLAVSSPSFQAIYP